MCTTRNIPRARNVFGLALLAGVLSSVGFGCGEDAAVKSFDQAQNEDPQFKASMDKSMERYKSMPVAGSRRKASGRPESR